MRVIYIAGAGRSGSTLLDRTLGSLEGFNSIGEARHLLYGSPDWLCGCWKPLGSCPFWGNVIRKIEGFFQTRSASEVEAIRWCHNSLIRNRQMLLPYSKIYRRDFFPLSIYRDYLRIFYDAIFVASDGGSIVDSSKSAAFALQLSMLEEVELKIIHLVRDPRAVVNSLSKLKRKPEIRDREVYLDKAGTLKGSLMWNVANYAASKLKQEGSYALIRYEDFASSPGATLARIRDLLHIDAIPDTIEEESFNRLSFTVEHTVSGNPMRMQSGLTKISPDVKWYRELPRSQQLLATILCAPLMVRYGYRA